MKWKGRRQSDNVIQATNRRAALYARTLDRMRKPYADEPVTIEGIGAGSVTKAATGKRDRLPSRKKGPRVK